MTNLQLLHLHENKLSGAIPAELGRLANLRYLFLHNNELTGSIPSWLGNLPELLELSLWSNELSGPIPPGVAPAQDRAVLRVLYNETGGADWTNNMNWLSGEPLSEWYGVTTDANGRVTILSLSANGLTGTIGAELGVLTRLTEAVSQRQYVERTSSANPGAAVTTLGVGYTVDHFVRADGCRLSGVAGDDQFPGVRLRRADNTARWADNTARWAATRSRRDDHHYRRNR